MTKKIRIEGTDDAWESGALGEDEKYVAIAKDVNEALIDDSLELQMISIRLQKSLIEEFKVIAQLRGIGYQPLIRQILRRFADCEMKQILRELAAEENNKEQGQEDCEEAGERVA